MIITGLLRKRTLLLDRVVLFIRDDAAILHDDEQIVVYCLPNGEFSHDDNWLSFSECQQDILFNLLQVAMNYWDKTN